MGPENEIITQLAAYLSAAQINDVGLCAQARQAALKLIGDAVSARSPGLDPLRSPASPPVEDERPANGTGWNSEVKGTWRCRLASD